MTAAEIADRVNRAWPLWQEATASLETASELMTRIAPQVSNELSPSELDPADVRAMHKALARFSEKFNLLAREQKRRVVR